MQSKVILFSIVAAIAVVTPASATPGIPKAILEARQDAQCSVSSGCDCFSSTLSIVDIDVPIDSCDLAGTGNSTCTNLQPPVNGTTSTDFGDIVFSVALGTCSN